MKNRIAVIGGGMAGLTAAYLLHGRYDVTVFEKSGRLGGNAYTLTAPGGLEVDIAAAVFGRRSYKNLLRLFGTLNIETAGPLRPGCAGLSGPGAGFYNLDTKKGIFLTSGVRGLIAQKLDILRPGRLKSMLEFAGGVRRARALLRQGSLAGLTVEQALGRIPRFRGDAKLVFLCCLSLISSMHCDDVLDAPAAFFIDKLEHYDDLMPPKALFGVCFAKQGTRSYVDALSAPYRDNIFLNARIRSVARKNDGAYIRLEDGRTRPFDKVVFACNADQALQLLEQPTDDETRLLGAWKYTEGTVVVHADHACFPRRDLMEGYTCLYRDRGGHIETSVSGSLRSLPGVPGTCDLVSTQHPNFPIAKDRVIFEKVFRTPLFDFNSCRTVPELPSLNGSNNTYYCGSHFGFGLHEDAVTSAIEVARGLGVGF